MIQSGYGRHYSGIKGIHSDIMPFILTKFTFPLLFFTFSAFFEENSYYDFIICRQFSKKIDDLLVHQHNSFYHNKIRVVEA